MYISIFEHFLCVFMFMQTITFLMCIYVQSLQYYTSIFLNIENYQIFYEYIEYRHFL